MECGVCWSGPRSHCFVPCGHQCICAACAEATVRTVRACCPMCRAPLPPGLTPHRSQRKKAARKVPPEEQRRLLAAEGEGAAAAAHYEDPSAGPCQAGELAVRINGVQGGPVTKFCGTPDCDEKRCVAQLWPGCSLSPSALRFRDR